MQTINQYLLGCCTLLAVTGCAQQPDTTPAERLDTRLRRCVEQGLVLLGHQDDLFYGKHWNRWESGREQSDIRAVAGDYPAVLGVEIGCIELGDTLSLDRVPFRLIREGIAEHHRRGGVVTVSWHAANPATGGDSWDVASAGGTVARMLEGGDLHILAREWLARVGDFLASLRDDDGEPIPVIWRPWHEMAGEWFWWGAPYCSPEEYRALWRMTFDYLQHERGLTNLLWAISPGFTDRCKTGYTDYYPGDDCVDLIGIDIYQYGSGSDFRDLTRRQLEHLAEMARSHDKLLALTETGCEAIPDSEWWTATLRPALDDVPVAYVLLWRNAWDRDKHYYAPFEGEASADDFRTFTNDERIGLLGDLNALGN
ncbi:glycoside hydrolase family 26 protein [Alistipes sp.]|uniref:glycoside hydrolase family 26 protein n=1 Tax=Alistipes sp. TaxID=1872444 RepID=UPI003A835128